MAGYARSVYCAGETRRRTAVLATFLSAAGYRKNAPLADIRSHRRSASAGASARIVTSSSLGRRLKTPTLDRAWAVDYSFASNLLSFRSVGFRKRVAVINDHDHANCRNLT